jgi:hypothetical protein
MVAAQTVLANLVGARVEIRDKDAGVITALAADNFAAGQRICPAEAGTASQFPIDPTRVQVGMVGGSEV